MCYIRPKKDATASTDNPNWVRVPDGDVAEPISWNIATREYEEPPQPDMTTLDEMRVHVIPIQREDNRMGRLISFIASQYIESNAFQIRHAEIVAQLQANYNRDGRNRQGIF